MGGQGGAFDSGGRRGGHERFERSARFHPFDGFLFPYAYYPFPGYTYAYPHPVHNPPAVVEQPPSVYQQPLVEREVVLPDGKYMLEGDGVTQAYQWVWVPAAPARRGSEWRYRVSIESVAPCVVKVARQDWSAETTWSTAGEG